MFIFDTYSYDQVRTLCTKAIKDNSAYQLYIYIKVKINLYCEI